MKVLLAHNFYQQGGGEDVVFAAEGALLEEHGHEVVRFTRHNDAIQSMAGPAVAAKTLWSRESVAALEELLDREKPEVVHFHNTFPLISPAAYRSVERRGIPVIQTLHNYRLLCPSADFFRQGKVCERCAGKFLPWPGVVHRCYRGSTAASATVAAMLTLHRALGSWSRKVDRFIALTDFARGKFLEHGFPADQLVVKPNFLTPDPGPGSGQGQGQEQAEGGYALFVGRLSEEKGLRPLLEGWRGLGAQLPLQIVGGGPLEEEVKAAAAQIPGVTYLGRRPREVVLRKMGEASVLVFPSLWYEGLPMTILEAFARGTPVLASDLGSMAELIEHSRTGWLVTPGDPEALRRQGQQIVSKGTDLSALRKAARQEFEAKYTAEANYRQLLSIYRTAIEARVAGS